jgi:hypothetical protein
LIEISEEEKVIEKINKSLNWEQTMPKKSAKTDDTPYRPGELVLYQFPQNHIRSGEWIEALIIKVFKNSVELEIENKRQITQWKDRIKKCESRR